MKGYVQDMEAIATGNEHFRQIRYAARSCQRVVTALKPQEDIGAEVRQFDQFFRVELGRGKAVPGGVRMAIQAGSAMVVPSGVSHDIINTGTGPMKIYTIHASPNHRDGVVHHQRTDTEADTEYIYGKTPK